MAKKDYTNLYIFLAIFGFIVLMFTILAIRNKKRIENPEDNHEDFVLKISSGSRRSSYKNTNCNPNRQSC